MELISAIELMKRKNKLVFDVTEEWLIPKDQIVKVKKVHLIPFFDLYATNCIYCALFNVNDESNCTDCPMAIAKNRCLVDKNNTYQVCSVLWKEKATKEDKRKLYDLIKEYNKSNGFE